MICFAAAPAFSAPRNEVVLAAATAALQAAAPKDRIAAAYVLGREKATEHIPDLQNRLSAEADKTVRQAIVMSLANLGAPAFQALKAAFADPIPEVRLEAVVGLGRIGSPESAGELLSQLSQEKNDGVRMAEIFWLGELKHVAATDAAAALLKDSNPHIRIEAAYALGKVGTVKSKDLLGKAGADKDPRVTRALNTNKR